MSERKEFNWADAMEQAWREARQGKTEEQLRDEYPRDQVLTRNAIHCLRCNTEAESTHRHEMKSCSCGLVSVDGGLDYSRVVWKEENAEYIDLCEYREETFEEYEARIQSLLRTYGGVTDEQLERASKVIRTMRGAPASSEPPPDGEI